MEALQWAVGILVTIQLAVTGFIMSKLWAHIERCAGTAALSSSMAKDLERMKEDIGTHDTGMRGDIHRISSMVTAHEMTLTEMRRK